MKFMKIITNLLQKIHSSQIIHGSSSSNKTLESILNTRGNFIQVYCSANPISLGTSAGLIVPIDTVEYSKGTSLTLNSTTKRVVVGAGVSRVKVTAMLCPRWDNPAGACAVRIYKNSQEKKVNLNTLIAGQYITMTAVTYLDVVQGDTIAMYDYTETNRNRIYWGANLYGTHMIVEVIE